MPLQLRAEGRLRGLVAEVDEAGLNEALENLRDGVAATAEQLSAAAAVRAGVRSVLDAGAAQLLQLVAAAPEDHVAFQAEDGSLAALLRAIQPALDVDAAGALPLRQHGSTTTGILSASEAMATGADPDAVIVADDFGDDLDASASEYLAARLRRSAGQVWLSTRRSEVVRAFRDEEILRLTRHGGVRRQHQLSPPPDRKARVARRQLLTLLLAAMSAETVALLEGPHDLEGYGAVAERRLRRSLKPPPAAFGVRLLAPAGHDGGKDRLPALARLASELGFRVRVALDGDAPGADEDLIIELQGVAEKIVRLPDRTAVERALVSGLSDAAVTFTLDALSAAFSMGVITPTGAAGHDLQQLAVTAIKRSPGYHQAWVDLLPRSSAPPLAVRLLDALCSPSADQGQLVQL